VYVRGYKTIKSINSISFVLRSLHLAVSISIYVPTQYYPCTFRCQLKSVHYVLWLDFCTSKLLKKTHFLLLSFCPCSGIIHMCYMGLIFFHISHLTTTITVTCIAIVRTYETILGRFKLILASSISSLETNVIDRLMNFRKFFIIRYLFVSLNFN